MPEQQIELAAREERIAELEQEAAEWHFALGVLGTDIDSWREDLLCGFGEAPRPSRG